MDNIELDLHQSQAVVAQLETWYESMGLEQSLEMKVFKLHEEVNEGIEAIEIHDETPTPENREHLKGELGDILFCTLNLLNHYGISADDAMNSVFTKNMGRCNPEHVANVKNGSDLSGMDLYKKAKQAYDSR
jgi:NTP pyrophosphatase (non-canonical NTP hydrolase)